nr:hypothetical protein [Nocardia pseudovaccinii]
MPDEYRVGAAVRQRHPFGSPVQSSDGREQARCFRSHPFIGFYRDDLGTEQQ